MNAELLCAVTAAARAAAFIDTAEKSERALEPPHPAFAGFRRLAYIWVDGGAWQPVGDRFGIWLEFLRGRAVRNVLLDTRGDGAAVWTVRDDGADAWHISDTGEQLSLCGGAADFDGMTGEPVEAAATALRETLVARVDGAATPMQREALQRAIAILDSTEDGSEVSDVAWPYFVMPEHAYTREARRLFGAAASAWSGLGDPWPEPARRAVSAAVNSISAARGEPSTRGEPVQ